MNEIEKHKREFNHSLLKGNNLANFLLENGIAPSIGESGNWYIGDTDTGLPSQGEDATTLRIDSSRGVVFKNSEVSTVLSVVIYRGTKRITDIVALREEFGNSAHLEWQWQRINEDTFGTISAADSRISNSGFTFTLSPADVDTKVVFMCQLITD